MQRPAEGLLSSFGDQGRFLDTLDIENPSAGANAASSVPGSSAVRVLAATATLTTSATVANRQVNLDYINGRGVTYVRNGAGLVIAANTTLQAFHWSSERSLAEWASGTPVYVPLLPLFLQPGWVVQFTVDNIQAADQLTACRLVIERFLTGSPELAPLES